MNTPDLDKYEVVFMFYSADQELPAGAQNALRAERPEVAFSWNSGVSLGVIVSIDPLTQPKSSPARVFHADLHANLNRFMESTANVGSSAVEVTVMGGLRLTTSRGIFAPPVANKSTVFGEDVGRLSAQFFNFIWNDKSIFIYETF